MNGFAFTLVIDAGSILSLFFWIIAIVVGLVVIVWALGSVFGFFDDVNKKNEEYKKGIKGRLTIGEVIGYSLLVFVVGSGLTFLLLEVLSDDLWYLAIAPFFGSFFVITYISNRLDKERYHKKN